MKQKHAEASQLGLRRTVKRMLLLVLFMFGFAYMLVPLYNVLCKQLGINGKTNGQAYTTSALTVDKTRTLTVELMTNNNTHIPWQFSPSVKKVTLHPGEKGRVSFFAKNESAREITIQAIPSVAPGYAAKHMKKTECFCFEQQTLAPGESREMPLIFHLDVDLPKDIKRLTLAYTLFDVTGRKLSPTKQAGRIAG